MASRDDQLDDELDAAMVALGAGMGRLLESVDGLADADYPMPSRLPGWTRAHVLTHLARSTDSRTGLLAAARAGRVGRQYESAESRARDIEAGATRPADAVRADLHAAFDRFLQAVAEHPADRWDAPADWIGGGRSSVRRTVPSLLREIELHHVDLDCGYRPADWPAEVVAAQLGEVAGSMSRRGAPALTIRVGEVVARIGDGGTIVVAGPGYEVLAWLTGRGDGSQLTVDPAGPLPSMPPLS